MPAFEKFKVAAAGFASIGFMNLSLNANSVGFYQITKLTIIPVTMVLNAVYFGVYTNTKIKLSLGILLAGVGVATVAGLALAMYYCRLLQYLLNRFLSSHSMF